MHLEIRVRSGARAASVGGTHDGALIVRVAEVAERGRATAAALRAVAEALGVPARDVRLVAGTVSRRKVIDVRVGADDRPRVSGRLDELRRGAPLNEGGSSATRSK